MHMQLNVDRCTSMHYAYTRACLPSHAHSYAFAAKLFTWPTTLHTGIYIFAYTLFFCNKFTGIQNSYQHWTQHRLTFKHHNWKFKPMYAWICLSTTKNQVFKWPQHQRRKSSKVTEKLWSTFENSSIYCYYSVICIEALQQIARDCTGRLCVCDDLPFFFFVQLNNTQIWQLTSDTSQKQPKQPQFQTPGLWVSLPLCHRKIIIKVFCGLSLAQCAFMYMPEYIVIERRPSADSLQHWLFPKGESH